jgi:phosphatidylserine/phosphatidylglycerophosphate/cardiolipin synthase-like enzyme
MQALLDAVVDLAALVSPAKVRTIASALRGLANPGEAPTANTFADTAAARAAMVRVLDAWAQGQVNGDVIAGLLLGASEARLRVERELNVELVWTGPTTRFVPTRRTEQVLLDLIASSKTDLFLVSFIAYDVPSVVRALNEASTRGVRLRVLLEASASHGGSLAVDPSAMMHSRVPAAEILTWMEKPEPFVDGKVHAKLAIIDCARAFITSANLTGHALGKNMEAGVLINGGPIPKTLADHFQALIDVRVIVHRDIRLR